MFNPFKYIDNLANSNLSVGVNEFAEFISLSQTIPPNRKKVRRVYSLPNILLLDKIADLKVSHLLIFA